MWGGKGSSMGRTRAPSSDSFRLSWPNTWRSPGSQVTRSGLSSDCRARRASSTAMRGLGLWGGCSKLGKYYGRDDRQGVCRLVRQQGILGDKCWPEFCPHCDQASVMDGQGHKALRHSNAALCHSQMTAFLWVELVADMARSLLGDISLRCQPSLTTKHDAGPGANHDHCTESSSD